MSTHSCLQVIPEGKKRGLDVGMNFYFPQMEHPGKVGERFESTLKKDGN